MWRTGVTSASRFDPGARVEVGRSPSGVFAESGTLGCSRLEVRGLSKTFGHSKALADVCLTVAPGEVHALVGENGCGKSTLIKVLSGYHAPDPGGVVLIDGEPIDLPITPTAMRRCGLAVVHQDLGLLDSFDVTENIRLGHLRARPLTRAIAWRYERDQARGSLAALGANIDPAAKVSSLSGFERTEVAIARALQHRQPGRGLVMFDESTRALPPEPRLHFHALTRGIAADGGAVLLVSHQLEEVLAHADRVTVLRDGEVVSGATSTSELCEHDLIVLMLGCEPAARSLPRAGRRPARASDCSAEATSTGRETAATVERLEGRVLRGVSLTIAKGEVLGVTGLLGSGFEELPYLLAGARRPRSGTLTLDGHRCNLASVSLRRLLDAGVALVPQARGTEGLALSRSVMENVTLPRISRRGGKLRIGEVWQREETEWVIGTLGVRPADPAIPAAHLSGGNQQKVLIGKWLCASPRLLLTHEPTQGVDVGARADIEAALAQAARNGCAVILASMDVSELSGLCDRILVTSEGAIANELAGELTTERIVAAVYGGEVEAVT